MNDILSIAVRNDAQTKALEDVLGKLKTMTANQEELNNIDQKLTEIMAVEKDRQRQEESDKQIANLKREIALIADKNSFEYKRKDIALQVAQAEVEAKSGDDKAKANLDKLNQDKFNIERLASAVQGQTPYMEAQTVNVAQETAKENSLQVSPEFASEETLWNLCWVKNCQHLQALSGPLSTING